MGEFYQVLRGFVGVRCNWNDGNNVNDVKMVQVVIQLTQEQVLLKPNLSNQEPFTAATLTVESPDEQPVGCLAKAVALQDNLTTRQFI